MKADHDIERLADAYGIAPRFTDALGNEREVTPDTKQALLAAMGVAVETPSGMAEACEHLRTTLWSRQIDPATVVHQGGGAVVLRGSPDAAGVWTIVCEDRMTLNGTIQWNDLPLIEATILSGRTCEARTLRLPTGLPLGYHRLHVEIGNQASEASIVVVPDRAWLPDAGLDDRAWAMAVQLYGLHSARSWGIGDFGDLGRLAGVAAGMGADAVSISPTHAMFPADPGHFGPYGPSSRLFLNILHIDVGMVPGFGESPAVTERAAQADIRASMTAAQAASLVDYSAVAAAKLPVFEASWQWFRRTQIDAASPLAEEFSRFRREAGKQLADHALFDALHAHFFGADLARWDWRSWPDGFRGPREAEAERFAHDHPERTGFYAYLQWLADRQLAKAQEDARAAGMAIGLYRDLAVGTHPGGSMAWSNPQSILVGAHVGAPPDAFNQLGQDWGLSGLSPMGLKQTGFTVFSGMLRANMRHAGALRIDHVMALDRLFLIPAGATPAEGAYIDYPAEALHGILRLESQRHRCIVVGEDLGTVPAGFRERLSAGGILGYRVFYFERTGHGEFADPASLPKDCLLAATTHDLPTLAGYWSGGDIALRNALDLFASPAHAEEAAKERLADRKALLAWLRRLGLLQEVGEDVPVETIIAAVYEALAQAPSRLLAVQAEDLMGVATQPNLPGTVDTHPNWRRKLPLSLEELAAHPPAACIAAAIGRRRRSRGASS